MPQLCPESAVQSPSRRSRHASAPRRAKLKALATEGVPTGSPWDGPPLAILALPSPTIGDTCTAYNEMLFWVGWFTRFRVGEPSYVPYEIRTLDCPVVREDGSLVLRGDGQPQMMRCVREVARSQVGDKVRWLMISWNVGQVGVTMPAYDTLDDAMRAFHASPTPVPLP